MRDRQLSRGLDGARPANERGQIGKYRGRSAGVVYRAGTLARGRPSTVIVREKFTLTLICSFACVAERIDAEPIEGDSGHELARGLVHA